MSIVAKTTVPNPAAMDVHPLTIDFLRWLAQQPRSYEEAMGAWRTSCPRLSIWEDALADGLIVVERAPSMAGGRVSVTALGFALLEPT